MDRRNLRTLERDWRDTKHSLPSTIRVTRSRQAPRNPKITPRATNLLLFALYLVACACMMGAGQ